MAQGIKGSSPLCAVEGCLRRIHAHGFCGPHNHRWERYKDPLASGPPRRRRPLCKIEGCERLNESRGWCPAHYRRWRKYGDPLKQINASPGHADHYDAHGYHRIHVDGRIVIEHRWVMEQHLGRTLLPGEEVHHKNGRRTQNNLGNLELWLTQHQPKGQRASDLLAWAREIIARYEPVEDRL
jgi:hypothetical protein